MVWHWMESAQQGGLLMWHNAIDGYGVIYGLQSCAILGLPLQIPAADATSMSEHQIA